MGASTLDGDAYPIAQLRDVGVALLDCEHRTPKPVSSGYPYVAIPDIQDGRLELRNARLISREDFLSWTKKTKPQQGDVIVTRRGRVGDTAIVRLTWTGVVARAVGPFREGQVLTARVAQFVETRDGRIAAIETFDCYEPFE